MKKQLTVALAILVLALTSCERPLGDIEDYFPMVRTVSAELQPDGSVVVVGEIESEGAAPIDYVGFSCNSKPDLSILDRQVVLEGISEGRFTATFYDFAIDSTYYFQAWASNGYGYAAGQPIRIDSVFAEPVVAPCAPSPNSLDLGIGTYTYFEVGPPVDTLGVHEVHAECSFGPRVVITFASALKTQVLTTDYIGFLDPGQVAFRFYHGTISSALNPGSNVYVNQIAVDEWEVTICEAPWTYGGNTYYLTTHFVVPF